MKTTVETQVDNTKIEEIIEGRRNNVRYARTADNVKIEWAKTGVCCNDENLEIKLSKNCKH